MNCLNGEKYLEEALQSIKNQSYSNWELIFWDNNSIDNSKNIFMKNFDKRMIYFKSNHTEPFGTVRNKAMSKANGELVALNLQAWLFLLYNSWSNNHLQRFLLSHSWQAASH